MLIPKFIRLSCLLGLVLANAAHAKNTPITSAKIDALVERTMKTFNVPGIAVAVIKDDQIVHSKGYGIRSIQNQLPMDTNTLVCIASNSKAFTAAALAILVDEKKLNWNDKVTQYIPEFRLYNPYVTEEFTVLDLMTHRSGLGLGAGDLMFTPDGSDFTVKDAIHNLRYLKPVSSFRSKYDYDNTLYTVAAEVIKRVSGLSWEDFIEKKIMHPLGMQDSAASQYRVASRKNRADPHVVLNGVWQIAPFKPNELINGAGGIYSNIEDMSKWVRMQLKHGVYGESADKHLFSEEVQHMMWSPQTIMETGMTAGAYKTHFSAYGIGWFLSDVKGYKQVAHTGGMLGMVTQVTLIPELKLGIVVLTNQESRSAYHAITNTIKDSYLGMPVVDRVTEYSERDAAEKAASDKILKDVMSAVDLQQKKNAKQKIDLNNFTGTYQDDWFGQVVISTKNDQLLFSSKRSPGLTGEMGFYKGTTFVVRWSDRTLDADAFVNFVLGTDGKPTRILMKAISPATDSSFDFHDLDLKLIK